jgi:hypothetical protein
MNNPWKPICLALIGIPIAALLLELVRLPRYIREAQEAQRGKFCGQMSCSALKEIVLKPGVAVPIADMDCKCSRWDSVEVE